MASFGTGDYVMDIRKCDVTRETRIEKDVHDRIKSIVAGGLGNGLSRVVCHSRKRRDWHASGLGEAAGGRGLAYPFRNPSRA